MNPHPWIGARVIQSRNIPIPAPWDYSIYSRGPGPRKCKKHPSTFGGFVRIKLGGQEQLFGLICFHCVASEDCNHSSYDQWLKHGIFANDKTNDLQMNSPSLVDTAETERAWKSRINETKNGTIRDIERRLSDPTEFVTPGENMRFTRAKEIIYIYIPFDQPRIFPTREGVSRPRICGIWASH